MMLTRAEFQRTSLELQNKIEKQFSEIMAALNRSRDDELCDDRSPLDRYSPISQKVKESGFDHFERSGVDRRFGGGQFHEGDRQTYGSSAELLDLRFRDYLMLRNDDDDETWTWTETDQAFDDEDLVETEIATELIGIEDETVKREANAEVISAIVKKEQIPQIQVPISKLEHGLQIHNVSPTVCEDYQYVVGCDELCEHQGSILEVSHVGERNVLVTESASVTINREAHQLFDKMPSKEKCMKHLKAWKFKFKSTSKRSRLMDDKFSFVDATVLLNKDPQEIIWDCVNKEFKETVAGCGKKRVDRFKLVDEKESRPEVMDMNQTFLYHQIGHGVDILLVPKLLVHDKEGAELPQRSKSLTISDCSDRSSRANRVWKPGGLLCVPNKKFEAELEIYDCETKKHMLLLMKLANRVWECGELLATHVYCKWLVNCYKSDRVLKCYFLSEIPFVEFIEFKACKKELSVAGLRQLSLASMTFELRNVEDGVKKDKNRFSGDVGAKILMALEELHLLQDVFEMVKELLLKTSLVIQSLVSQEPAISANQEPANSATQEPAIFQPTLRFLMNTRQSCLSLRANRVWDPGGSNSETD